MIIYRITLIVHIVTTISLLILIILQNGKGATAVTFGGGVSASNLFGSQGSSKFLVKATVFFAFLFFTTSLTLANFTTNFVTSSSIISQIQTTEVPQQKNKINTN